MPKADLSDENAMRWRPIASAPRDGSRIIAVIRGGEQGGADIDVVRWALTRGNADPCWVSSDSTFNCTVAYGDGELTHWMPLPSSMPGRKTPGMASQLPEFPRGGEEIGGSGI